jgi:transketolase
MYYLFSFIYFCTAFYFQVPIHTSGGNAEQDAEELRQLRENVVALTAQCAQLNEANRAWQLYQQAQVDNFRNTLHDYLPIDENASFDEFAQQLVDQIVKEREDFNDKFQAIEKANDELRSGSSILSCSCFTCMILSVESTNNLETIKQSYMNTVNELTQELLAMKEAFNELDAEKQVLANELEKQSTELRAEQARQTFGMFLISST